MIAAGEALRVTEAVRRLFALKETYDRIEARLGAGSPHWYVHMMAVEPSRQGRGLGSELLARVLRQTAGAHGAARHPTILTTHNERNVAFYRRAGFEVVDVEEVRFEGAAAYPVWGMSRA